MSGAATPNTQPYHEAVPAVVLYREGVTLGERWARCGFGLPLRSWRASWERLQVDVDQNLEFSVRTGTRHVVIMSPGRHEVRVSGRGFVPSSATIELTGEERVIVALTPQYLESVSRSSPLGQLRAHVVGGPEELHPYRFYKSWPVFVSALGSSAVVAVGLLAVAAAVYVLTQHLLVGLVLLACISVVVPTLLISGIGGLVTAVRFLRLASDWRAPRKAGAPVGSGAAERVPIQLPGTGHEPRKGGEGS
jgi:hypothetical protein